MQLNFGWNKSLLRESSWSNKDFYGHAREKGVKKLSTHELFDSIIVEFKAGLENTQFKEKKIKNFEAKNREEVKPLQIKYNNLKQQ